jgi:hypothetical protein
MVLHALRCMPYALRPPFYLECNTSPCCIESLLQ